MLFTNLLSACFIITSLPLQGQSIEISLPLNRAVYQRNAASQAQIPIAVQFRNPEAVRFTYKIDKLDVRTGGAPTPTEIETHIIPSSGLYQRTSLLNDGWYQLEFKTLLEDNSPVETSSVKFGVGEVIFSAGQSNIQGIELGIGGSPLLPAPPYDGLSAVNQNCFCKKTYPFPVFERMERGANDTQKKIAPNGNQNLWCYEVLGRLISDQYGGIPVAFFNTGSTGTTMGNWSDSANDLNAITHNPWLVNCNTNIIEWASEGPEGHPYRALRTALNYYGGMFGARVVLWHQGESDNLLNTSGVTYQAYLQNVINRSRQHYHARLGWAISRVSYFPPFNNGAQIVSAQENTKFSTSNTVWGAYYSDQLDIENDMRDASLVHFNRNGLVHLGQQFALGYDGINPIPPEESNYKSIMTLTPVPAQVVPNISVSQSGSNYTLTVTGNPQSYCWVQNNGSLNNCVFTSPDITVSSGSWRCYVTHIDPSPTPGHEKKNVSVTRNISLPLTHFSATLSMGPVSSTDY